VDSYRTWHGLSVSRWAALVKNTPQQLFDSLPKPVLSHIQHLERMRQDFVANVSHELRTPLTVIHGYLEILLEQTNSNSLDPATHKIYTQMYQQTVRMQNLIADLLLLSSLESNELEKKDLDHTVKISQLLDIIVEEAKALSNDRHTIKLFADMDLMLLGNENELRALFSNIIFNAVKYTPSGGCINVFWETHHKKAIFKVVDTGIGIAPEHIPRITERFYRVDKARSRESGGTGLGLAIAKHVLIRHEGKLDIQSNLGNGSIFSCIFPAGRLQI
jgi:two-component system, OmpR family, phosphate regulon sensor histidine kinase PhoR